MDKISCKEHNIMILKVRNETVTTHKNGTLHISLTELIKIGPNCPYLSISNTTSIINYPEKCFMF